jgi:hypothetical protein
MEARLKEVSTELNSVAAAGRKFVADGVIEQPKDTVTKLDLLVKTHNDLMKLVRFFY